MEGRVFVSPATGRVAAETHEMSRACRWSWVDTYIVGDKVIYQGWWWEALTRNSGVAPSQFGAASEVWRRAEYAHGL